jgi:hypothetical protein
MDKTVEQTVKDFIKEQHIYCAENIYQSDRVIENAYVFIEKLCNLVGYYEEKNAK